MHKAVLDRVEQELAFNKPFGDQEYLSNCLWRVYSKRMDMVSHYLPIVTSLRDLLENCVPKTRSLLIRDPSFRIAIDRAVMAMVMEQRPHCPVHVYSAIEYMVRALRAGERVTFLFSGTHAGTSTPILVGTSYIWQLRTETPLTQLFIDEFNRLLASAGFALVEPTPEIVGKIRAGYASLASILPSLVMSALVHTPIIVLFHHVGGVYAFTNPQMPGVLFISEAALSDAWKVGDYLLHEAMHSKDVELENTHALIAKPAPDQHSIAEVLPLWRRAVSYDPASWSPKHALTVMHVYVALACFYSCTLSQVGPEHHEWDFIADVLLRDALDRASFIADSLDAMPHVLGTAGLALVRWLRSLIGMFDPASRSRNATVRHLLSLYGRDDKVLARAASILGSRRKALEGSDSTAREALTRVSDLVRAERSLLGFITGLSTECTDEPTAGGLGMTLDDAFTRLSDERQAVRSTLLGEDSLRPGLVWDATSEQHSFLVRRLRSLIDSTAASHEWLSHVESGLQA